jgi:sulfatase maturation enzyme AslB (radical SAM superfamily)
MDVKKALKNGVFCPMPWAGLMYNHDGKVKNCIRSAGELGNIKNNSIEEILHGPTNLETQQRMLDDQPGRDCYVCYDLERDKKRFDIVSDRIFYLRELKHIDYDRYQLGNHELRTIDVRWSNLCNFACVYCGSTFSSRWAQEIKQHIDQPSAEQQENFKNYIFDNLENLHHVYLAGGEPLLMKQNLELLERLKEVNPSVNLRINTNLSKVDTQIFEKICTFDNVHWIISVDEMEEEFDYVRYGGSWQDFLHNLNHIQSLPHKTSFNMLHFALNDLSLFDTVDFLRDRGFHPNSFIIGPLLSPLKINIRHLPATRLDQIKQTLTRRIDEQPGYLLEDSYRNLLHYINQPFQSDMQQVFDFLSQLDHRRGLDSQKVFPSLYELKESTCHKEF